MKIKISICTLMFSNKNDCIDTIKQVMDNIFEKKDAEVFLKSLIETICKENKQALLKKNNHYLVYPTDKVDHTQPTVEALYDAAKLNTSITPSYEQKEYEVTMKDMSFDSLKDHGNLKIYEDTALYDDSLICLKFTKKDLSKISETDNDSDESNDGFNKVKVMIDQSLFSLNKAEFKNTVKKDMDAIFGEENSAKVFLESLTKTICKEKTIDMSSITLPKINYKESTFPLYRTNTYDETVEAFHNTLILLSAQNSIKTTYNNNKRLEFTFNTKDISRDSLKKDTTNDNRYNKGYIDVEFTRKDLEETYKHFDSEKDKMEDSEKNEVQSEISQIDDVPVGQETKKSIAKVIGLFLLITTPILTMGLSPLFTNGGFLAPLAQMIKSPQAVAYLTSISTGKAMLVNFAAILILTAVVALIVLPVVRWAKSSNTKLCPIRGSDDYTRKGELSRGIRYSMSSIDDPNSDLDNNHTLDQLEEEKDYQLI